MATQAELIAAGWTQEQIDQAVQSLILPAELLVGQTLAQEIARAMAIKAMLTVDPLEVKTSLFGESEDLLATQKLANEARKWANITGKPSFGLGWVYVGQSTSIYPNFGSGVFYGRYTYANGYQCALFRYGGVYVTAGDTDNNRIRNWYRWDTSV